MNEKNERLSIIGLPLGIMAQRFVGGNDIIEQYASKGFISAMDFARYLHSIEPSRSVQAWRMAVIRWAKLDESNTYRKGVGEYVEPKENLRVTHARIYYDKGADIYLTWIESMNDLLQVEGEKHRDMRRAYSSVSGGMTSDEMALKFDMPSSWIIEYIRAHGWRHAMDPFTDEEVLNTDVEDLTELFLFERRRKIAVEAQKRDWLATQREAKKYREIDATFLADFKKIIAEKDLTHGVPHIEMEDGKPYAVVISPTDLHYGKYGWGIETGESYDLDEATKRLSEKTSALISRLPSRPELIVVATGSDWFHVDNEQGTTTKGTSQDLAGSPAEILMGGCELARKHIEMLRGIAPIQVVFMNGNHDRHTALALALYLHAVYENCDDVEVIVSPRNRQYLRWQNNLLGFTHGDFVKGVDLPLVMANEKRDDWGSSTNHVWFTGHKHHTHMIEKGGCFVIQLPSLSGTDRYHHKHGYLNRPGIFAFLLDAEEGIIGSLYAPVIKEG